MNKEKLLEDLYNKVPENSKIVVFGVFLIEKKKKNDLAILKPNSTVIGFIDNNYKKETFCGLPVWRLKEAVDLRANYDIVIMSTRTDENRMINTFDIYDIPVVPQTLFVSDYYRNNSGILNDENYSKVIDIFDKQEDKELYKLIFNVRKNVLDLETLSEFFYENISNKYKTSLIVKKQYLEKINKDAVKIVFDAGLNDGFNVIAYNRQLVNLQKVYGFEAIYDVARNACVEDFILNDRLEIVPLALGDCPKKINFYINKTHSGASFGDELTNHNRPVDPLIWECREIDVDTIDNFCRERKIIPDLIKMDIEGAEPSALKGGMEAIKKCRPQLAISIYHSSEDFINIPLYLKENLENYKFRLGHYSPKLSETVLYAIPEELV